MDAVNCQSQPATGVLVRRALLTLLVLLAAVSLRAQDGPTTRTGTNAVRVDMYASRDGKALDDLTASDVELAANPRSRSAKLRVAERIAHSSS